MKWIMMAVVMAGMAGAAGAADFSDLQRLRASGLTAMAAGNWPQQPPIDAGSLWNQINNQHPFPQLPPANTLDTCVFTELNSGKCYFKCKSGKTLVEPPIKTNTAAGEPADVCATHIFLTRPAPGLKAAKTVVDLYSVDLTAADGTRVFVDYTPVNLGARIIASPVWVSAYNPKFTGSETVTAKLMTYYEATAYSADALKETAELQLPYNGWDFQVKAPDISLYEAHPSWHHTFRQEVAVSVNGTWLTDRVSGTPVFRFKLAENPADEGSVIKAANKDARACLFKETQGETCVYKCEGGTNYTRPMKRPGPWNDEPVVPCPQVVFTF